MKSITKVICAVFSIYGSIFGLEAPYLISANPLDDSRIELAWRNNDISTQGFIVQRKESSEINYQTVDTIKSAVTTSFIDTKNLKSNTAYDYHIMACNSTTVSSVSNSLQTTTLASLLKKPSILVSWNCDTSKSVKLVILDSSKSENGYNIYRSEDFTSSFSLIGLITISNSKTTDSITWFDTTALLHKWYNYQVKVYSEADTLLSESCSTYTFRDQPIQKVFKFNRISEFPLLLSGWSAKAGDSIILKESNSPDGKYSVINIKNPETVKFDGYIDSISLLSYPAKTLIPAFLKFGIFNSNLNCYRDVTIIGLGSKLGFYKFIDKNYISVDSLTISSYDYISRVFPINDAIVCFTTTSSSNQKTHSFLNLTSTGYTPLSKKFNDSYTRGPGVYAANQTNILGFSDNKNIIAAWDYTGKNYDGSSDKRGVIIYNTSSEKMVTLSGNMPFSDANNTGHFISATETINLQSSVQSTALFISDIRDSRGYQTAVNNDAIYHDTTMNKSSIKNLFVDTLNKLVFLVSDTKLTILSYQHHTIGIVSHGNKVLSKEKGVIFSSSHKGITATFPQYVSYPAALRIYDLSGRMVYQKLNINSNVVHWIPKKETQKCYVAVVTAGKDRYASKLMVK